MPGALSFSPPLDVFVGRTQITVAARANFGFAQDRTLLSRRGWDQFSDCLAQSAAANISGTGFLATPTTGLQFTAASYNLVSESPFAGAKSLTLTNPCP